MIILHNSNGTLKDNENLKQGFCKKYKGVNTKFINQLLYQDIKKLNVTLLSTNNNNY